MPRSGDVLHVGKAASVQFGEGRHLLFRVIRVMQPETQNTYTDWAWLEGYELNSAGDAVERREIYVKPAGLRQIAVKPRPVPHVPRVPRPRNNTNIATTRSTR